MNSYFGGAFCFAKYGLQFRRKKIVPARAWRKGVKKTQCVFLTGEEFRHARAVVRQQADKLRRFRRLGIKTSKQNNFQILLRKIWRAGVKKLKENCFALLAGIRLAETRSGIIRAIAA
ncbi:hypothetical protein COT27_01595 [Candidatus Kuenenbacteria bacterium CG08_land_8_20_14_0_20_37_23]|uniref:Uncharacterized protein n=1 Tax=Candidatus Kuenenbacteria bacterium CG08_land_8_20_14_0_20_37_23 TaxID=1974617 RepID=A0A2M6XSU4_9BACT|nr:MAG: hypothetical protein COT27_01595 [Candidatus Kuenenbacteria bacterium CG08_land_8_20_14_0_20_37_23]